MHTHTWETCQHTCTMHAPHSCLVLLFATCLDPKLFHVATFLDPSPPLQLLRRVWVWPQSHWLLAAQEHP